MTVNATTLINQLAVINGRLGPSEVEAANLIEEILNVLSINYVVQEFDSQTPVYEEAILEVNGKRINCLPCGLVSGEITDNSHLISSLTSSQNFIDQPNINFNPKSDAICVANFYFAPALAISRLDVEKVIKSKKIKGTLEVKPAEYMSKNILVGNAKSPKNIIFAHYDAYFSGSLDNASGVGVIIELISKNPSLAADNLFVFAGNEELSYDFPVYWGRGFRQFKKANPSILKTAKKIVVVDCVGNSLPIIDTDPAMIKLAFPIGDGNIIRKTRVISGDFNQLMAVYHSRNDKPELLDSKYLTKTVSLLESILT